MVGERGRGVILGYVHVVSQTLVAFLYTPLLLRGIGQSEYGLYQLVGSISAYMNIMESMLTSSALRFYCKRKAEGDEVGMENILGLSRLLYRGAALLVAVIGTATFFGFKVLYASSLSTAELEEGGWLLAVLVANIVLNMLNYTYSVVISAYERFTFGKAMDILSVLLQPVVVLAVITAVPYAIVIVVAQFVVNALCWIMKRIYVFRSIGAKAKIHKFSWADIKPLLIFSLTVSVAMIADMIFAKTDQLIIGLLIGSAGVAVYSVGYQVYSCYSSLGIVMSSCFMPKLSVIARNENRNALFSIEWARTGRLTFFLLAAVVVGFSIFGQEFISLWVGDGYEEAYWVALLMMAAYFIDIIQRLALTILQVVDLFSFRARVYVASALANIPLTVVLSSSFGIIGAAASSALVLFVSSGLIMNWYYSAKVGFDVPLFWKEIVLAAKGLPLPIATGILLQIVLPSGVWLVFLVKVLLFAIIYAVSCAPFLNQSERDLITHLIKQRKA